MEVLARVINCVQRRLLIKKSLRNSVVIDNKGFIGMNFALEVIISKLTDYKFLFRNKTADFFVLRIYKKNNGIRDLLIFIVDR